MMKSLNAPVGVILLDEVYLTKEWPVRELRRMMELVTSGQARVLPVMYNITFQDLEDLMDRLSVTESSATGGASRGDAALLKQLSRISMIHSSTSDVVCRYSSTRHMHGPALPCSAGATVGQLVICAPISTVLRLLR